MAESVDKLNAFLLKTTKDQLINSSKSNDDKKVFHVVIGNEASDMDSMVSSAVYAFYKSIINNSTTDVYVPIYNIPREDFALRTETTWIYGQLKVNSSSIIFMEKDVVAALDELNKKNRLRLVLVDHNRLAGSQEKWANAVEEIVDHHKDEKLYNAKQRDIEVIGSCCTLVANQINRNSTHKGTVFADLGVAKLLLGTILLDTVNLDPKYQKATSKDIEIAKELSNILHYDTKKVTAFYEQLAEERFNVSSLSTTDLLRSDYKQWKLGKTECGISSAKRSIAEWLAKEKDQFIQDADKFSKDRALDVLMIMTVYQEEPSKQLHRELIIHTHNQNLFKSTVEFLSKSELQLKEIHKESSSKFSTSGRFVGMFEQLNVAASRKQLQPLAADLYEKL